MMGKRLLRRMRVLLHKGDVERELDDELRVHVDMETADLVRRGLQAKEARREALRRFGGVERTKERVRDERGGRLLEDLLQDLRQGARGLRRSPGFTTSALLVLSLGIGSAVTLFAAIDAVLLEPLPFPRSDRLVRIWPASPSRDVERATLSYPDFLDWRERSEALVYSATYSSAPGDYVFLAADGPVELSTEWVAGDFFEALGVAPLIGRVLSQDDAEEGRQVAVLSHGLWQRLFGGDRSVVNTTFTFDHRSFEIVGVMPPGFTFPVDEEIEIWVPLTVIPEDDIPISLRPVRFLQAFGRLAQGATPDVARQELSGIASSLATTYPDSNAGVTGATVTSMRDWMVGDVRRSLWVALAAVGLILLLACSNVANLLLARGTARAKEVALRMSLGAPSERIVRQLLTETLLLTVLGGAFGILLSWLATQTLAARTADFIPRGAEIGLDGTVLGAAVAIALVASAFAGIVPALRAASATPAEDLRGSGRDGGPTGSRLRRMLVAAEVTLAVLLLTGAGLLGRSLAALGDVDPGFETEGRIAMTLTIADQKYPERAEWMALYHDILDRLEAHPEVRSAGAIRYLPFRGTGESLPVRVPGLYEPVPDEQRYGQLFQISDGLIEALGMRLLRGRGVAPTDGPDDPIVAVVNVAFQREFFQGEDPLGRRITAGAGPSIEIVGIVADVRHRGLSESPRPSVYIRNDQIPRIQMSYVVETEGDPLAIVGDLRRMVREIDPDQAISGIVPLVELTSENLARPRFFTGLLGGFGTLALLLAALGVYGVLAFSVRSQIRETGLRLALGASGRRVALGVLGQGMRPVLAGLVLGLAAAAVLTRFVSALLFGVEPLDGITFAGVVALLSTAAIVACLVPAWAASRVDPMVSLRGE